MAVKLVWLFVLVVACAPANAVVTPTEDPRVAVLQAQNDILRGERDALALRVEQLNRDLQAATHDQTFYLWSGHDTPMTVGFLSQPIPDTFTYHLKFTATSPVRVRIMNLNQYVALMSGRPSFAAVTVPATMSADVTFHDSEGCGGYITVLDAAPGTVILMPEESITRHPADHPTGDCAP